MNDMIPAWVNGKLIPVEKLTVHRQALRHPAVSVFVMAEDRVLLQRRAAGKYHSSGLWTNTCCTHPAWGESARDCAVRRLRDELGVTGLDPIAVGRVEYRADVGAGLTEHEVVDICLAEAPRGLPVEPNPTEVGDVRWVALDRLAAEVRTRPSDHTPWLRIYLDGHFARLLKDRRPARRGDTGT
ncbi:MAG: isopentenyl-diphosphate Delta-isomerase [Paracoccaceae bacterium]